MKNKLDLLSTNKLVDLFINEEIRFVQNAKVFYAESPGASSELTRTVLNYLGKGQNHELFLQLFQV